MRPCPVCASPDAPRPSGDATYTYNGVTHKTRECAAIASVGEQPVRTATGYKTKSGAFVCMDCFDLGRQHTYSPDEKPHDDDRDDPRRRHDIGLSRRRWH